MEHIGGIRAFLGMKEDADATRTREAPVGPHRRRTRDAGALGAPSDDSAGPRPASPDRAEVRPRTTEPGRRARDRRDAADCGALAPAICDKAVGRVAR